MEITEEQIMEVIDSVKWGRIIVVKEAGQRPFLGIPSFYGGNHV
jgi:hypothetical protein